MLFLNVEQRLRVWFGARIRAQCMVQKTDQILELRRLYKNQDLNPPSFVRHGSLVRWGLKILKRAA